MAREVPCLTSRAVLGGGRRLDVRARLPFVAMLVTGGQWAFWPLFASCCSPAASPVAPMGARG
eukprot:2861876-Lingulodinium_polyedra.AAC.1